MGIEINQNKRQWCYRNLETTIPKWQKIYKYIKFNYRLLLTKIWKLVFIGDFKYFY